jgi:long-chain acyl-CoA synthetase
MSNQPGATLYPRISKRPPFSVEVPGYEKVEGETIPRVNPKAKNGLITKPAEDVATVWDIVKRGADKFGNAKAVGQRKLIETHVETKKIKKIVDGQEQEVDKKWTYFELSGYTYYSFIEYERLTIQLGSALRKLGLQKEDRLHMFGATRRAAPRPSALEPLLTRLTVSTGSRWHTVWSSECLYKCN